MANSGRVPPLSALLHKYSHSAAASLELLLCVCSGRAPRGLSRALFSLISSTVVWSMEYMRKHEKDYEPGMEGPWRAKETSNQPAVKSRQPERRRRTLRTPF